MYFTSPFKKKNFKKVIFLGGFPSLGGTNVALYYFYMYNRGTLTEYIIKLLQLNVLLYINF